MSDDDHERAKRFPKDAGGGGQNELLTLAPGFPLPYSSSFDASSQVTTDVSSTSHILKKQQGDSPAAPRYPKTKAYGKSLYPAAISIQGVDSIPSLFSTVTSSTQSDEINEGEAPSDLGRGGGAEEDSNILVTAHLAPTAHELATQVGQRLEPKMPFEVEELLTIMGQRNVEVAEVVVNTDVNRSATTKPIQSSNSHESQQRYVKVCCLRRKTWACIIIGVLVVVGGAALGVILSAPSSTTETSTSTSSLSGTNTVNVQGGADPPLLEDSTSPRSRAQQWLSTDPISTLDSTSPQIIQERFALAVLYFSTNGPSWNQQTFPFLSDIDICQWNNGILVNNSLGIFCGFRSTVEYIVLPGVGLSGTLPWELSLLSDLVELDFDFNMIQGYIPTELGDLSNLQTLWLAANFLTGPLPVTIPSSLLSIDFSNNSFTGVIPHVWGNTLYSVWEILCSMNYLTGPIPWELGQLMNLSLFFIDDNALSGTVPIEIAQLPNLTSLSFEYNHLTGSVTDIMCLYDWFFLGGDCLADSEGQVEIECQCCTRCCTPTGDYCEDYIY